MYCPRCKRDDLTEADFGVNNSRPNKLQAYCRDCSNAYQRTWSHGNVEKCRVSTATWRENNRERDNAYQREYYQNNPDKQRADNQRNHMKRWQAFVAEVDERSIFEQCGWICQLCGEPVDPTLRHPDPMSASLDHIIPIACGGTHEPKNVQLAHWICNIRKGATLTP